MGATEVLRAIEDAGGRIWAEDDQLGYRLPESARPLVEDLRTVKMEVLAILRQRRTSNSDTILKSSMEALHCDPAQWLPEFGTWVTSCCVFRDRRFRDIGTLWVNFSTWCNRHGSVPCHRRVFEWLLADQCFLFADGFVSGLILVEDEQAPGFRT